MSKDYKILSQEVLALVNQARTNPSSFVEILSNNLKFFKGTVYAKPGCDAIQTNEGRSAFEEAIDFLKQVDPVGKLTLNNNLSLACKDHATDIGTNGLATADGSDGSNVSDRIERYCEWDGALAENIDFGGKTAEDIVIGWIVDDGLKGDRTHRRNLFINEFKYTGIWIADHKEYQIVCIMNYTADVRNKGVESPYMKQVVAGAEKKKANNPFQEEDPDAPDNCVSVKFQKCVKEVNGKQRKVTKKIYTLTDGTFYIVEVEEA
jgi:uncharacterized protein YkwD